MKKYIVFKLNPDCTQNDEDVRFAQLELEAFFPAVKPLSTIFELLNYTDIKALIEHDTTIQRMLTLNLSHGPYQAFLAAADLEPALETAVKRLAFVSEIIFFQRSHDPALIYLQYLLTNQLASVHSVFNWHVFQITSLHHHLDKLKPTMPPVANPAANRLTERQIRALINWNLPAQGILYDAAPSGSMAAVHAAAMGIPTYAHENDRYQFYQQATALDNQLLAKGLGALSVRVAELLNESSNSQAHLFFSDIHSQFAAYKQEQQKKLNAKQHYKFDTKDIETVLAIKFLIENNVITAHSELNHIINTLLLEAIALFAHKRADQSFLPFINEHCKRFLETQRNFLTVKERYALDTRQIELLTAAAATEQQRFDGIIDLSRTQKAYSAPLVDLLFPDHAKRAAEDISQAVQSIENLNNFEIKNLGPYLGKSLLYLKSINARDAFRTLAQSYCEFLTVLKHIESRLNPGGHFCSAIRARTTSVIEIDMDNLFTDIAQETDLTLITTIPLKMGLLDKKIYIILFEKN